MRTWTRISLTSVAASATVLGLAVPASATMTTVAEWHMDDPGTMVDSVGSDDGTLSGISVIPDGFAGSGYHFSGNLGSHVEVPDPNGVLNPGAADFRITVHVRFSDTPNSTVGDYDLIRKGLKTTSGGDWKIEILPTSTGAANPRCWFSDGTNAHSVRGTQDLADGQWHTITCVKTSSADQLIVDGATTSSTPRTPVGSIANTAPVVVGQKWGGGDQYTGDMDEISVETGSAGVPGGDTTPPTFTRGTPAGGGTGIGPSTNVTATFSEKVQGVGAGSFTLAPSAGGAAVSAAYTSNTAGTTWTLNPDVSLAKDTRYTVTLSSGITDVATNQLSGAPLTWQFLTGPAPAVKSSSKSPAPGAVGVAVTTTVKATFTEPVRNVTPSTFTLTGPSGGVSATVTRSGTTNTWILDPASGLAGRTTYTVTLVGGTGGITDLAGNPLKTVTWRFTTA